MDTPIYTFTSNLAQDPLIITILILGWSGIIINHFKLHWKLFYGIKDRNTIKELTDEEIRKEYQTHLAVEKDMSKTHPNYIYFRKGGFATKIKDEYFKRRLDVSANHE